MRLKEAMMTVVVAAFILTATRQAVAQPVAINYAGTPGYEVIDLTHHNRMASPYTAGELYPGSSLATSDFSMPLAVDPGVFTSDHQGWSQPNGLLDLTAVPSSGFDSPGLTGLQGYPAGALGAPVPEPASVAMLAAGLALLGVAARRRVSNAF